MSAFFSQNVGAALADKTSFNWIQSVFEASSIGQADIVDQITPDQRQFGHLLASSTDAYCV